MEGLLEVVGLGVDDGKYHDWYTFQEQEKRGVQILGAAMLKQWASNEMQTYEAESKLVSESLRRMPITNPMHQLSQQKCGTRWRFRHWDIAYT